MGKVWLGHAKRRVCKRDVCAVHGRCGKEKATVGPQNEARIRLLMG